MILSFALTCHKIQGITVKYPRKVAIDLRTVWGASQAYVMLGRVQKLSQLFIIGDLPRSKIYCDKLALDELALMRRRSLNENPEAWEQNSSDILKIAYHNVHSLQNKIPDIKADQILSFSDILIFGETWITDWTSSLDLEKLNGYPNNMGRGRGLAIYCRENIATVQNVVTDEYLQMSAAFNRTIDIISF